MLTLPLVHASILHSSYCTVISFSFSVFKICPFSISDCEQLAAGADLCLSALSVSGHTKIARNNRHSEFTIWKGKWSHWSQPRAFQKRYCDGLNCVPQQCWNANPSEMVSWDGDFGRWLGLDEVMGAGHSWWDQCPYESRHLTLCHFLRQEDQEVISYRNRTTLPASRTRRK